MHRAAEHSKTPAVLQALLDAGADPNARAGIEGFRSKPLHLAAEHGKIPAVVQALLDAGADPNAQDEVGRTALDLIPDDSPLRGTDVYWQLNSARF
ncbi:ankyrin repeat domain-containing protein [Candidatus Synechococcus spongiarum]|uniref:ankyrin repeat domain-containing protein n=1 Tax=Candidatus Synechococcus spongiarum TaxID=431041 RepID=UPI001F1910CB|nr:ankyrin repeat domain-containing protein [Candidatus Synechococcus spongiarum]